MSLAKPIWDEGVYAYKQTLQEPRHDPDQPRTLVASAAKARAD